MSLVTARRGLIDRHQTGRKHRPDYWLVLLSLALLVVGMIVVYAISPGLSVQKHVSENYYTGKQFVAIGLGILTFLFTANMPLEWWRKVEKPLIFITLGSAVVVRLLGEQVNGAYRWIQLGGLSFQPAELIKFTLILWLAAFLADRLRREELHDFTKTLKPLLIALGLVALVAKLESDLGSPAVMVAIMGAMVFVIGLPLKRLMMIFGLIAVGGVLLIASSGYRRDRLTTFLNPTRDCLGSGYQACEALTSIGSGGMFGLGLGRSVQAFGYLPEAANDSIFAIYAEKFGFVGVTLLLGLFVALFARIKRIVDRAPNTYARLIVVGVLAWFTTQTIINVGAMIGLLPLKGITLPFISYGGTSLIFVTAAIGLAFNISRYTSFSVNRVQPGEEKTNYGAANPPLVYRARS